jgi:hypothetical protein
MSRTYDAVLTGDHLEWKGTPPSSPEPVAVKVVVPDAQDDRLSDAERGAMMADALAELARIGAFREIDDPAEWEREIRRDRPLPGRNE